MVDVNCELSITEAIVANIRLSNEQASKVASIPEYMWESYKAGAKSFIANTRQIPLSLQPEGSYSCHGNQLKLTGSELFIEIMLIRLLGEKNIKAEQQYIIPIDKRIRASGDEVGMKFLSELISGLKLNNNDDNGNRNDNIYNQRISIENLEKCKKQLEPSEYRRRVLISLAVSYRLLQAYCDGFDKARMTRMNGEPVIIIEVIEYESKCRELHRDCMLYIDALGW